MLFKMAFLIALIMLIFLGTGCDRKNQMEHQTLQKEYFGKLDDVRSVYRYSLLNKNGLKAQIIDFGATLVALEAPDRQGQFADVLLGYDSLQHYVNDQSYFGGIVGRYGNRIAKGRFNLNGQTYQLTINNGENHLHGGLIGFNKVLWAAREVTTSAEPAVKFTYLSADGEQGYPGNVTLQVTYTLTDDNELRIDYEGTTDQTTILNPTNHAYFNLSGSTDQTILGHELKIAADHYTPVDAGLITSGELAPVEGTPMDFRTAQSIGARIDDDFEQLKFGRGYDHNWVLNDYTGAVRLVATLYDPRSGRLLEVLTDQPGLQFYSGNFLDGSVVGKGGINYQFRTGLCLEAQHFPDSPNKPHFPPVTLQPGEVYRQTTIYRFSIKDE